MVAQRKKKKKKSPPLITNKNQRKQLEAIGGPMEPVRPNPQRRSAGRRKRR